jgi:hypothetical protein
MGNKHLIMNSKMTTAPMRSAPRFCDSIWQNRARAWYNGVKFRKILCICGALQAKDSRLLAGGAAQ